MSLEIVKQVMEAEEQADVLKKEAAVKAKQIALDCQKACAALMEKTQAQAREEKLTALKEADELAQQEGEEYNATIAGQCEAIAAAAASRTSDAVDIVVERIVRG